MAEIIAANPGFPAYLQIPPIIELPALLETADKNGDEAAKTMYFLVNKFHLELTTTLDTPPDAKNVLPRLYSIRNKEVVDNLQTQLKAIREALTQKDEREMQFNMHEFVGRDNWTISFTLNPDGSITKKYQNFVIKELSFEVTLDDQDQLHLPQTKPTDLWEIKSMNGPDLKGE